MSFPPFLVMATLSLSLAVSGCGGGGSGSASTTVTGYSTTLASLIGHNQELAGRLGRQDWGGSGDQSTILGKVAEGWTMVVDFLPEKAGCGYVNCTPGQDVLQDYLNDMVNNGASTIHQAALDEALNTLKSSTDSIVLQLGNEIYSSSRQDNWETFFGPLTQDEWMADYVEYWFAPFIEQVMQYEAANGVDFKLFLGSIGNAGNSDNTQKLLDTWNYVIQGWTAPSLAGTRLGDLLDCATGHYLLSNQSDYQNIMDTIFDATGCYWATEEIGRARSDAGIAYPEMNKVIGRFLDVKFSRNLGDDAFRILAWETGNDAANAINDFLDAVGSASVSGVVTADGINFTLSLDNGASLSLNAD